MRILAIEKETTGPEPDYAPHLKAEARRVWELQQAGVIRDILFTAADRRAVLMLECESEEAARDILASLPLVQAGCIAFDVYALRPYDGLARLFAG